MNLEMEFRVSVTSIVISLLVFSIITQGFVPDVNAQMATKSTTSIGFVQIDKSEYDVSYTTTVTVKVNGTVLSPISGDSKITILFKLPDGSTKGSEVAMLPNGYFETSLVLDSNSQKGTYSIITSYANNMIGSVYFTVKQVAAKSILNEIANQTIPKPVTNQNNQTSEPNTPSVSTSSQSTSQSSSTQSSSTIDVTKPSKIPTWVKRIFVWYGQGQVSEDELLNAVQYLVQNKLIKITIPQSDTSQNTTSSQTTNNVPIQNQGTTTSQQPKATTTQQSTSSSASTNNMLTNSEFVKVQNNPDDYVDQWAKLSGSFTQDPFVQDGSSWVLFDYSEGNTFDANKQVWFVYNDPTMNIKSDDCAIAEGHVKGKSTIQYKITGATSDIPSISLEKLTKISCLEAKYPAISTINVQQSQTQGTMKITIEKVEISNYNARVFLKVENLGNTDGVNFDGGSIVQGTKQYDSAAFGPSGISEKNLWYTTNIQNGVVDEGVLFFEPIANQPFQLMLKGYEGGSYNDDKFSFNISP